MDDTTIPRKKAKRLVVFNREWVKDPEFAHFIKGCSDHHYAGHVLASYPGLKEPGNEARHVQSQVLGYCPEICQ